MPAERRPPRGGAWRAGRTRCARAPRCGRRGRWTGTARRRRPGRPPARSRSAAARPGPGCRGLAGEQGGEQLVLGAEAGVEGAAGEAAPRADVLDAGRGEADLGERLERGVEQPLDRLRPPSAGRSTIVTMQDCIGYAGVSTYPRRVMRATVSRPAGDDVADAAAACSSSAAPRTRRGRASPPACRGPRRRSAPPTTSDQHGRVGEVGRRPRQHRAGQRGDPRVVGRRPYRRQVDPHLDVGDLRLRPPPARQLAAVGDRAQSTTTSARSGTTLGTVPPVTRRVPRLGAQELVGAQQDLAPGAGQQGRQVEDGVVPAFGVLPCAARPAVRTASQSAPLCRGRPGCRSPPARRRRRSAAPRRRTRPRRRPSSRSPRRW